MGRLKPSSSHSHRLSKTMCAAAAPFCQQPAAMRVGRHIHQLAHRPLQPLVVLQPLRQPTARLCLSARAVKAGTQPLEYTTLAEPTRTEVEVKKSRFVVTSWPVTSGSQAASLIKQHSDPGASHNCYGYRVSGEQRSSDDGEPSGTAGRPILSAIESEGLDGVAVLVTRYFGGVKLGAGGLVRAYGNAARTCLRAARRITVKARVQVQVSAPYEMLGALYTELDKCSCERLSEDYEESEGESDTESSLRVVLRVMTDADQLESLQGALKDSTAGKATVTLVTQGDENEKE